MIPTERARREPYARLARSYDGILGWRMFELVRRNFERMGRAAALTFRDAADLGCGTGIFAAYLARQYRKPVFAVDRSRPMLEEAQRRCAGLPVRILRQDLRELRLPAPVDLLTCNYDTLNHLAEAAQLLQALEAMRRNLRRGGHLFGDFLTPALGVQGGGRHRFVFPGKGGDLIQELRFDFNRRFLLAEIRERKPGGPETLQEQHRERLYPEEEMRALLGKAGLAAVLFRDAESLGASGAGSRRISFLVRAV